MIITAAAAPPVHLLLHCRVLVLLILPRVPLHVPHRMSPQPTSQVLLTHVPLPACHGVRRAASARASATAAPAALHPPVCVAAPLLPLARACIRPGIRHRVAAICSCCCGAAGGAPVHNRLPTLIGAGGLARAPSRRWRRGAL